MTGQIAGPSTFSLELVGLVIGVSMIVGTIDVIRQPGWAWRRARESKAAYLILVLLLPLVGLGLYLYNARPKVAPITAAGRAASLPFEQFGRDADQKQREDRSTTGTTAPPVGLGSFGEVAVSNGSVSGGLVGGGPAGGGFVGGGPAGGGFVGGGQSLVLETAPAGGPGPVEISETFFSAGAVATRTLRSPAGLTRTYRPKQRTSLPESSSESTEARPTVPAGWKADPTGRHQFRYWDGFQWTENVADAGQQTRDSVSS